MTTAMTVQVLTFIAALAAGVMAGVYFAFSGFIMRSLDQLEAAQAADAMNAINEVILRSAFMPLFFGSTLLFVALTLFPLLDLVGVGGAWLLLAGVLYVVGMFACTALFNVPFNNRLAAADEETAADLWRVYYRDWSRWNHVRALCSLTSCGCCVMYLVS